MLLEICVDTIASAEAAIEGGADRIELCASLETGGLTPSAAMMRTAADFPLPVVALIRPRTGNFDYTAAELALIADDIRMARQLGLAGVVIGATSGDKLAAEPLSDLIALADGMTATLHRAVDVLSNPVAAVDDAIALGFDRILTSGGASSAPAGLATLAEMTKRASGRISIMPGAGINAQNSAGIVKATGAREIHASCSTAVKSKDGTLQALGFEPLSGRRQTDAKLVRALKSATFLDGNGHNL